MLTWRCGRFVDVGHTGNSEHAAIANVEKRMFGLQFHPEVCQQGGGSADPAS
jgi:GMP synthase-like glutamine amidotransferase